MSSLTNATVFLINALFDLYLYILAVRLVLAIAQANYFNPLTQVIIKLTLRLVNPVRRVIPNFRRLETATLIWILVLEGCKLLTLSFVVYGQPLISLILFNILTETLKLILNTYFYAILLQAILTWIQQGYTPISQVLLQITTPITRPFQRIIPPIGGIDISPIPALLLLQFLLILIP